MKQNFYSYMDSPVGRLLIAWNDEGLSAIQFQSESQRAASEAGWQAEEEIPEQIRRQLEAYFRGELHDFDLPLSMTGTPFQLEVWKALQGIPYGSTISYAELARRIGNPQAVRAVGAANGKNPVPIVVPCHRVIGSSGKLTGYGGGLHIKEALLNLEREFKQENQVS